MHKEDPDSGSIKDPESGPEEVIDSESIEDPESGSEEGPDSESREDPESVPRGARELIQRGSKE